MSKLNRMLIPFAVCMILWMFAEAATKRFGVHTYFAGSIVGILLVRITDVIQDLLKPNPTYE